MVTEMVGGVGRGRSVGRGSSKIQNHNQIRSTMNGLGLYNTHKYRFI